MESLETSLVFSVYSDAVLLPLTREARRERMVGSPVVSATVVGQIGEEVKEMEVKNLKDPVRIVLQLHNKVLV